MIALPRSAEAVQSTFVPVADTYVNESSPGTNYGSNSSLRVDGSPIVNSYLRFDVQGLSGSVTSATLRIFAVSNQSVGFQVHDVTNDTWGESVITYSGTNAAPPISAGVIASTGPVTAGQTYDLNVTSLVTGNGLVSFGLKTTHTTALGLGSRESSNSPQLIVEAGGAHSHQRSDSDSGPDAWAHCSAPERTLDGRDRLGRHVYGGCALVRWA
jgi:hypothetical protein